MYSQNDEEAHILKHLAPMPRGRLLDIGANDGRYLSNSLALIERAWSGVLVEANPLTFALLLRNHSSNPFLDLVNAAIGTGPDYSLTRFWSATADGGKPDPTAALSTTQQCQRDAREWQGRFQTPFYVPLVPMAALLNQFPGDFHFLNIDTEGTSAQLFAEFPFPDVRPLVVCVEHDGYIRTCCERAERFGYREVSRNAENLIFVHKSLL